VSVTFAFVFDSRESAEAARARLIADAYRVDVQPQEYDSVVLAVVAPKPDSAPELVQARLARIAETLGGESLGYGGFESHGLG
jgi:hypothetical protein